MVLLEAVFQGSDDFFHSLRLRFFGEVVVFVS